MATISLDVAGILREVVHLIAEIKNERTADKEKAKAAHLLVYRALSLHPALDQMRPPTGILADIDWFTELRSTFASGIFRKLGTLLVAGRSSQTVELICAPFRPE